jgi:hypothetical protein
MKQGTNVQRMEQFCPLYINVEAKAGVLIIGLNVNAKPFYVPLFVPMIDSCIDPQ